MISTKILVDNSRVQIHRLCVCWVALAAFAAAAASDKDYDVGERAALAGRYSEAAESYAKAADRGFVPALCELGSFIRKVLEFLRTIARHADYSVWQLFEVMRKHNLTSQS